MKQQQALLVLAAAGAVAFAQTATRESVKGTPTQTEADKNKKSGKGGAASQTVINDPVRGLRAAEPGEMPVADQKGEKKTAKKSLEVPGHPDAVFTDLDALDAVVAERGADGKIVVKHVPASSISNATVAPTEKKEAATRAK